MTRRYCSLLRETRLPTPWRRQRVTWVFGKLYPSSLLVQNLHLIFCILSLTYKMENLPEQIWVSARCRGVGCDDRVELFALTLSKSGTLLNKGNRILMQFIHPQYSARYIILITWVRVWYGEIFHEQVTIFSLPVGEWKYRNVSPYHTLTSVVNILLYACTTQ
jgi:hypothetical protein